MIGLLSQGIRVGQWNRLIATLEGHIIGDPTFRFSVAVPHTLALDIGKSGRPAIMGKIQPVCNTGCTIPGMADVGRSG